MKIKVPFVKNSVLWKGRNWCGPIALASLLRYYKDRSSVKEIVKGAGTSSGGTSPEGLVFFCLSKGFNVNYINKYKNQKEYSKRFRKFLRKFEAKKYEQKFKRKCIKFSRYKFIRKSPTLKDIEKYAVEAALRKNNYKKMATCRQLGVSKGTLRRMIQRHGIKIPEK